VKVGDLVKKDMAYCGPMTAPDMMEEISSLYGIVIAVDKRQWGRIV